MGTGIGANDIDWYNEVEKKEGSEIMKVFTAYVELDMETGLYVGIVPGIPGAHTQSATLDELQRNLKEVLELCLEDYEGPGESLPKFVGLQQIEVAV